MPRLAAGLAVLVVESMALAGEDTRALEEQALAAIQQGDFRRAIAFNREIWARDRTAVFAACNIGTLSYGVGDMPAAVEFLTLCQRLVKPPRTSLEQRKHATVAIDLALAKQQVGTVEVFTNREGARVAVAGRPVETATPVFVHPGKVIVTAQHEDRVARIEVDVPAGEERIAVVDFSEPPIPPPAPVAVAPAPPLRPVPVAPPNVTSVGTMSWEYPIVIAGGVGLTLLGIGIGINAHFDGYKAGKDADAAELTVDSGVGCNVVYVADCRRRDDARSLQDTLVRVEVASFTIASLSAAGTAAYAIIDRPKQPTPLPLVAVRIDRPTIILGVKGKW